MIKKMGPYVCPNPLSARMIDRSTDRSLALVLYKISFCSRGGAVSAAKKLEMAPRVVLK